MKGVQNTDKIKFSIVFEAEGIPLTLKRVGEILTINLNGNPSTDIIPYTNIFERDVSALIGNAYLDQDFSGGIYNRTGSRLVIINVSISNGILTLLAKTAEPIPTSSTLAFQAVVMI